MLHSLSCLSDFYKGEKIKYPSHRQQFLVKGERCGQYYLLFFSSKCSPLFLAFLCQCHPHGQHQGKGYFLRRVHPPAAAYLASSGGYCQGPQSPPDKAGDRQPTQVWLRALGQSLLLFQGLLRLEI